MWNLVYFCGQNLYSEILCPHEIPSCVDSCWNVWILPMKISWTTAFLWNSTYKEVYYIIISVAMCEAQFIQKSLLNQAAFCWSVRWICIRKYFVSTRNSRLCWFLLKKIEFHVWKFVKQWYLIALQIWILKPYVEKSFSSGVVMCSEIFIFF